jgi:excisionase family DNA binding protein
VTGPELRAQLRDQALRNAMAKRSAGVPTYSVAEAAALLSISQEYLYRLIQAGRFPAVRMRLSGSQGRYVVPAASVEQLLTENTDTGGMTDVVEAALSSHVTADEPRRDSKGA